MYSVLYCVMHEHHNSIYTNQIKSNRIAYAVCTYRIAIPEPFFNPGIRDWEIYNPGIQGSRRDYRQVVIISRIMFVTIYIGCYNKLAFHSLANP